MYNYEIKKKIVTRFFSQLNYREKLLLKINLCVSRVSFLTSTFLHFFFRLLKKK